MYQIGTGLTTERRVLSDAMLRRTEKRGAFSLDSILIFIPLFMPRPALAAQADRPAPLVVAAGAEPVSRKCVPRRAAAFEKVLRVIAVAANPAARCVWTPFAERAANAVEGVSLVAGRSFLGSSAGLSPWKSRSAITSCSICLCWRTIVDSFRRRSSKRRKLLTPIR